MLNRSFILVLLVLLTACGNKGPVRPRQARLPEAVKSFSVRQRGAEFQLRWQMPQRNQDGSPLTDIDTIKVERLFSFKGEFCAECSDPWPIIASVHPSLPAPAQNIGNQFVLTDTGATLDQTARYRVRVMNRQGDAGRPLTLKQEFRASIAPPTGLTAIAHDKSAELRWQPTTIPAGAKLLGYQIYRREDNQAYTALPINLRPVKKLKFSDFGLQNSRNYSYRIRSLFNFDGELVESLPSQETSTLPDAG